MGLFANLRKNKSGLDDSEEWTSDLHEDVDPTELNQLGLPPVGVDSDAMVDELPPPVTPIPDAAAMDTTAPDTTAPDTTAPDTTAPDTTAPDTTAPDTSAPEAPVLEAPMLEAPVPDAPVLEAPVPDADTHDADTGSHDETDSAGWHLPDLGPQRHSVGPETPLPELPRRRAADEPRPPTGGLGVAPTADTRPTGVEPSSSFEPIAGVLAAGPLGADADVQLEILGLSPGATWTEVREAHRALIDGHRCDRGSEPEHVQLADEIRREMNTAFAALRLMAATH